MTTIDRTTERQSTNGRHRDHGEHREESGADRLADQLQALATSLDRLQSAVGRARGLGANELAVLAHLSQASDRKPSDLAAATGISTSSITNTLDRLEDAGLIARRANPDDRRSLLIELTDSGREATTEDHHRSVAAVEAVLGSRAWPVPEVLAFLDEVTQHLEAAAEHIGD